MSAERLWGSAQKRLSGSRALGYTTQPPCATSRFVDFSRCAAASPAPPAPAALGVAVHAAFLIARMQIVIVLGSHPIFRPMMPSLNAAV